MGLFQKDIIPLIMVFLTKYNQKYHQKRVLAPEVIDIFQAYSWPGNVRELENIVERLVVISIGDTVTAENLPGGMFKDLEYSGRGLDKGEVRLARAGEAGKGAGLAELYQQHGSTRKVA